MHMADSLRGRRIAIEGFCGDGATGSGDLPRPVDAGGSQRGEGEDIHFVAFAEDGPEKRGANWVDKEVVTDGQFISSRKPDDIPAFSRALIEMPGNAKERAA
jgi:putative intracellular protease/amidase